MKKLPTLSNYPMPTIAQGTVPTLKQVIQIWKHLSARRFFALTKREQVLMWMEMGEEAIYRSDYLVSNGETFDALSKCNAPWTTVTEYNSRKRRDESIEYCVALNNWGAAHNLDKKEMGIDLVRKNPRYNNVNAICEVAELYRAPSGVTYLYQTRSKRHKWGIKRDGKTVARSSKSFKKRADAVKDSKI